MALIKRVDSGSPAESAGIRAGDDLRTVCGHAVTDVLDLMFYAYDSDINVEIERDGKALSFRIEKGEGEHIGVQFDTYLIDKPRGCKNKCVFCFIDQMPKGLRETLYFKDDDARLSFLQGNYVSLTNLDDDDVRRICDMRISPINVSVHTTNPELRVKMLNNRFGGDKLKYLRELAAARIEINAQIVLCPNLNDGAELRRTLRDLAGLGIASCSIVPVGLTRHRDGLYPLRPVDRDCAASAIAAADEAGERCMSERGTRVFYCSDEMYFTAGLPIPAIEYYDDFPQIENGVGMAALFCDEFMTALEDVSPSAAVPEFALATGTLFAPVLQHLLDCLHEKCHNIKGYVYPITNRFFGENVTVAGLVVGGDLIEQLRGRPLGQRLFIPRSMLRSGEDVFLDDLRVPDAERELGVPVEPVSGGSDLLERILRF